jgi:hypothetical protein
MRTAGSTGNGALVSVEAVGVGDADDVLVVRGGGAGGTVHALNSTSALTPASTMERTLRGMVIPLK